MLYPRCEYRSFTLGAIQLGLTDSAPDILQVDNPITNGRYRQVYIHPHDDTKLIKVELPIKRSLHLRPISSWTKARRALRSAISSKYILTGHERELLGIAELRRKGLLDHPFFVRYYGEVQTNAGRGLIFERITNFYQGRIYKLLEYLKTHKRIDDDHLRSSIEAYFDLLLEHGIYIYGGERENIGIVVDNAGRLSVKIFDFKLYTNKALIKFGSDDRRTRMNIEIQRKKALGEFPRSTT